MDSVNDLIAFNGAIEGYKVHKQDAGTPKYYLYADKHGRWYFMRATITGAITEYKWRKQLTSDAYANLDAVWSDRGNISGFNDYLVFL